MKKYFIILISFLFLACSKNISEQKMIDILTDIYISDVTVNRFGTGLRGETTIDSISYYTTIFEKHGVEKSLFRETLIQYSKHPKRINKLYEKVRLNLDEMKTQYIEPARQERIATNWWTRRDSLKVNRVSNFNPEAFETKLIDTGIYDVRMEVLFEKKDSTINPIMLAYLYSSTDTIQQDSLIITKDTLYKEYKITVPFYNQKIDLLKIVWIDYDSVKTKTTPIYGYKEKKKVKLRDSISGGQHYKMKGMTIKYNKELSEERENNLNK